MSVRPITRSEQFVPGDIVGVRVDIGSHFSGEVGVVREVRGCDEHPNGCGVAMHYTVCVRLDSGYRVAFRGDEVELVYPHA